MIRRPGPLGIVALAGWLFADLLLVLALVTMADRPDPLAARRPPAATGRTPSPTPTGPRSLMKKAEVFHVSGTDRNGLIAQIRKRTAPWAGREAALAMTFGGTLAGQHYAHRVNTLLGAARPQMFTGETTTDDFLDLGAAANTALIRVYFYTSAR